MNNLITVLNCIAQAMGFSLTILFIGLSIKKTFSEFIKVFLIILITDLITFGNFEYLSLPLIVIVLLVYLYFKNKNIIINFVVVLVCILIMFIILMLISVFILSMFFENIDYQASLLYNILCGCSYVGLVLLLRKILSKFGIIIEKLYQKVNNLIPKVLILNLITIVINICIIPYIRIIRDEVICQIIYFSLILIFMITFVSSIIIVKKFVKVETEKAEKNKELELTVAFQKSIKKMYDDVMNFKHDYIKIYSTFKIFIENNDVSALKDYFNQNITPLQDRLHLQQFNVKSLINIKDLALQGIIYTSILKAENLGISISIDIPEIVNNINMKVIDLCRIIGIFLDNAIEESENIKNSYLNICIFNKNKCTGIIIDNSCRENINFSDISNTSTKGTDRGRGLNIVNSIIKNYNNVVNNTYIKDGKFIQELWIEEEDSE